MSLQNEIIQILDTYQKRITTKYSEIDCIGITDFDDMSKDICILCSDRITKAYSSGYQDGYRDLKKQETDPDIFD